MRLKECVPIYMEDPVVVVGVVEAVVDWQLRTSKSLNWITPLVSPTISNILVW